ncbi:unnamed protein product [Darwinula stevensoni]|uniref:Kringle domain-containing protein n=1 Tax=Darwinula stevensoni TaxID=69355 RepID=A0A7R8XFS4_9CRUS|nr:unnamed protein product [Darwinula stevensoni]CAG0895358.1 unnamed protein product [Darwinula stevensoni]
MGLQRTREDRLAVVLAFLLLSRHVASLDLIRFLRRPRGQGYVNVTSESQEISLGVCAINCVKQEPFPCYAFSYQETDLSCQLIANRSSKLVQKDGYWSYAQRLCADKYPRIENAKVSFEGWNGDHPAPEGGIVKFLCEHPKGFSDGAVLHTAECVHRTPNSWNISFPKSVGCEKVHIYPECRLTEKGMEYVGKVSVTEWGRKCLNWRDYPGGTAEEYPFGPHLDFSTSDPSGTQIINLGQEAWFVNRDSWSHHNYCRNRWSLERPWCFVSGTSIETEYCDIPMCTYADDVDEHHNFCRNPSTNKTGTPFFMNVNIAPWCLYIGEGGFISWEFCDIPFCKGQDKEKRVGTGVYPECRLSEKGREYVGSQNETKTGMACLPWDSNPYGVPWDFFPRQKYPSVTMFLNSMTSKPELEVGHNHCRNPGLYREQPWCFVAEMRSKWEYCDIPLCQDLNPPECKLTGRGMEYVGKLNVGIDGLPCLPWLLFLRDDQKIYLYDEVDGGHAFCRNYFSFPFGPACFATLEGDLSPCDVPFCPTVDGGNCDIRVGGDCVPLIECKTDELGLSYMGTKNVTRNGHNCLPWLSGLSQLVEHVQANYSEDIRGGIKLSDFFNEILTLDDLYPTHNFCRNWNNDEGGPWCYRNDEMGLDYCDIPICSSNDP